MKASAWELSLLLKAWYCHRLILREESELLDSQSARYANYRAAVPRLLPSPWPRIPTSPQTPRWAAGVKAEVWYWGFPALLFFLAAGIKDVQ